MRGQAGEIVMSLEAGKGNALKVCCSLIWIELREHLIFLLPGKQN